MPKMIRKSGLEKLVSYEYAYAHSVGGISCTAIAITSPINVHLRDVTYTKSLAAPRHDLQTLIAAVEADAIGEQQPKRTRSGAAAEADAIGEQQLCTESCPAPDYSR